MTNCSWHLRRGAKPASIFLFLMLILISTQACQTSKQVLSQTEPDAHQKWYCEAFLPISLKSKDRKSLPDSIEMQIVEHNAVWNSLCEEGVK